MTVAGNAHSKSAFTRRRTAAREVALRLLYQWDLLGEVPGDWRDQILDAGLDAPCREFCEQVFEGIVSNRSQLDARLASIARNWEIGRMAVVDRNILRLGICEITMREDTPRTVVINEAIELAKKYSTEHSGAFVNGILDQMQKDIPTNPEKDGTAPNINALATPAGDATEPETNTNTSAAS